LRFDIFLNKGYNGQMAHPGKMDIGM